jgi:hypothetical protein
LTIEVVEVAECFVQESVVTDGREAWGRAGHS